MKYGHFLLFKMAGVRQLGIANYATADDTVKFRHTLNEQLDK